MLRNNYRFLVMVVVGILIAIILKVLVFGKLQVPHSIIVDFIFTCFCTVIVWEANIRYDTWLNKRMPWLDNTLKRGFVQFCSSISVSSIIIYAAMTFYGKLICGDSPEHAILTKDAMIISILIIAIILSIETSVHFFTNWKASLVDVEKYKAATAQAQLQSLRNQVNPHFLFNNMSVLSSLVYQDQDKAVDFINQLAKVYRYVLDHRNTELVNLAQEQEFVQSYIYLLQIRFDKNISFSTEIEATDLNKMIPPLSLQILVENCIKHNEISTERPLWIKIFSDQENVIVENNLQLRINPEPSASLGLQNIKERYQFLSDKIVEVQYVDGRFLVKLPLLPSI